MKNWYVIHSKPQKEDLLWEQLQIRNIEVFFPKIRVNLIPRTREFRPYFPGYLFVNVDLDQVGTSILKWMPGAIGIVNFGNEFAAVPNNLIDAIRNQVNMINYRKDDRLLHLIPGDRVIVKSGMFSGCEAIFDAQSGNERVRVLLNFLGNQHIRVVVPTEQIALVK